MKEAEIEERFKKTIKQRFHYLPYIKPECEEEEKIETIYFIGGVLQSALHIIPDRYYDLKMWIYKTYGYDPGGCTDGQLTINEMMEE